MLYELDINAWVDDAGTSINYDLKDPGEQDLAELLIDIMDHRFPIT